MSELSCVIAERDRAVKACEQMVDRIRELIAQCEKLRAERNGVRVKAEQPLLLRIRELESAQERMYHDGFDAGYAAAQALEQPR